MIVLDTGKKAYTVNEVAKMLDRAPFTIRRYIRDGELNFQLIGKSYYTTEEEIARYKEKYR